MKRFMKLLGVVLALVLIFGAVGCALETPETGLGDRIVALENRISGLEATIASLPGADTTALSNELTGLRDELASIQASMEIDNQALAGQLASLRNRLEMLEEENGNGNGNGEPEPELTAKWRTKVYVLSDDVYEHVLNNERLPDYMVEEYTTIKPTPVEEPGDYEIKVRLENIHPDEIDIDFVVELEFDPRGDTVYVDEIHTDIYPKARPWIYWDVDVIGKENTTYITCLSETIYLSPGEEVLIRLVFTLAYK